MKFCPAEIVYNIHLDMFPWIAGVRTGGIKKEQIWKVHG